MIVPSLPFLGFAAVSALVFNIGRSLLWRQTILLMINLAFVASFSHGVLDCLPLAGFILFGYAAQTLAASGAGAAAYVSVLAAVLAGFFWLKHYVFMPAAVWLPFPYIVVGLSYVFFKILHLIVDTQQRAIEGRIGIVSYLNYTLNFTSLASGPIQRYQDYRAAETTILPLDIIVIGIACERIVVGYFKVAVASMVLSLAQHHAIDALATTTDAFARLAWGATIVAIYPIYLYCNFSGYMDVVIGVARFFRIVLPENFDRPFSSENFVLFWSRWHITLSSWLKTYIYNPLMFTSLSRFPASSLAPYFAAVASFLTFFLVGLWHGQTTEFLFFGLLQGGGVAANTLYQIYMQSRLGRTSFRRLQANDAYRSFSRGLTFAWFAFTLLWFWSNWRQIADFSRQIGPGGCLVEFAAVVLCATIVLAFLEQGRGVMKHIFLNGDPFFESRYVRTVVDTSLLVVTTTVVLLLNSQAPDIVYKTF